MTGLLPRARCALTANALTAAHTTTAPLNIRSMTGPLLPIMQEPAMESVALPLAHSPEAGKPPAGGRIRVRPFHRQATTDQRLTTARRPQSLLPPAHGRKCPNAGRRG